jgi:peptidoglycan/LPS O-acetylase OafA/YrhL
MRYRPPTITGFGRIPELDGLRGVAILIVMLAHLSQKELAPGGFGVTLFFVVSGFIITRLFFAEVNATGTLSIRNFYVRRFLRLSPALFASVAAIAGLTIVLREEFSIVPVIAALTYLKNYQTLFYPDHIGLPLASLGVYWSLAVEEHFYLMFPPLFLLLARRPASLAVMLTAVLVLVLVWRCILVFDYGVPAPRTYSSSDTRFDSPLTGALLATLCLLRDQSKPCRPFTSILAVAAGLALLGISLLIRDAAFRETFRYTIQNVAIALLIFALLYTPTLSAARRCLNKGPLFLIGLISYSLYLWHVPVIYLVKRQMAPGPEAALVATVATLLVGFASWWLLERGTARLRQRFGSRTAHPYTGLGARLPLTKAMERAG